MPYFILILALIQPIYALPFAVSNLAKRNSHKLYIFCIALALSSIAMNLEPSPGADLFRHYKHIEGFDGVPFSYILENYEPGYLVFDSYSWLTVNLGLPIETLTATAVFIAYFLVLNIFNSIKNHYLRESNNLIIFLTFIAFVMLVSPIGITSGIRNPLANVIVFYLTFRLIDNRRIVTFILGSIFALLIHPAALIPIIIVLIAYYSNFAIYKYSKFIILLAIIFMVSSSILRPVVEYLDSLANSLPFYSSGTYTDLDSHWGGGFEENASARGVIASYIGKIPTFFSLIYLLIIKPRKKDHLYTILCLCSLYLGIFFSYATLFGRLNSFYILIFCLFITIQVSIYKSKFHIYSFILFIIFMSLVIGVQLYSYSDFWLTAIESFYKPLIFTLTGV